MPGAGSLRLAELCDIPGLRTFRIRRLPNGWFYLERNDHVDVVRLLSYARDIPALLTDVDDTWSRRITGLVLAGMCSGWIGLASAI